MITDSEQVILFIINECYQNLAGHPMVSERAREFKAVSGYAARYGYLVTEIDFDIAIAERFNDGCEYEGWSENNYFIDSNENTSIST